LQRSRNGCVIGIVHGSFATFLFTYLQGSSPMKTLLSRLATASAAFAVLFLISCQDLPIDPWDPGDGGGHGGGRDTTWDGDCDTNWDWDDDRDNVGDTIIDGDTVIIWKRN
jgi:hypothetical protein